MKEIPIIESTKLQDGVHVFKGSPHTGKSFSLLQKFCNKSILSNQGTKNIFITAEELETTLIDKIELLGYSKNTLLKVNLKPVTKIEEILEIIRDDPNVNLFIDMPHVLDRDFNYKNIKDIIKGTLYFTQQTKRVINTSRMNIIKN